MIKSQPQVEGNPILDYTKHLIFGYYNELKVTYKKTGEDIVYASYAELEKDYATGKLWPGDLKPAVAHVRRYVISVVVCPRV